MSKLSFIKWSKEDYKALQQATREFNKRINLINKVTKEYGYDIGNVALPQKQTYKDLKSQILTRQQLNQTLSSLRRFQHYNAIEEVKINSEATISRWELEEIKYKQPLAIAKIEEQLSREREKQEQKIGYKGITNEKIDRLESTLKTLKNYDKKTGDELRYAIERIKKIGNVDYEIKRAQTFRDNFMKTFEAGLSSYENYDLFKKQLDSIKNPKDFYDYVSKSEFLMDSFVLYDSKAKQMKKVKGENGYDYSAYGSNEEAFNNTLKEVYGLNIKE